MGPGRIAERHPYLDLARSLPFPITSAATVYEICAGNMVWGEDEEGEDESLYVPEPVRRKVTPGRNEPCWCGSGRKYKKCHLESDEAPRPDKGELQGSDEFNGVRRRIGAFLGEVLPARDMKLALQEFFADERPDADDGEIAVTDWVLHDRVAPRLGRAELEMHREEAMPDRSS